jgi:hypothetical protein
MVCDSASTKTVLFCGDQAILWKLVVAAVDVKQQESNLLLEKTQAFNHSWKFAIFWQLF